MRAFLLLCISLCCSPYAYSQCQPNAPVRIVAQEYPPYIYSCDNALCGFAYDRVTKIFNHADIPFQIEIYPWKRALNMVKTQEADAIFTIYRTAERKHFLLYPTYPLIYQDVRFYFKDYTADLEDIERFEFDNEIIGGVSGFSYGKSFDTNRDKLGENYRTVSNPDLLFNMLIKGSINIAISDKRVAEFYLEKHPDNQVYSRGKSQGLVPSYIAFSLNQKNQCMIELFEDELRLIHGEKHW